MGNRKFDDLSEIPETDEEFLRGEEYHPSEGKTDAVHDALPDDIRDLLEREGVGREYSCTLYRIENGSKVQVAKYQNFLPDEEKIGVEFGPGEYHRYLSWKVPGKQTPKVKVIRCILGREYLSKHRDYLALINPPESGAAKMGETIEMLTRLSTVLQPSKGPDLGPIIKMVELQNEQQNKAVERLERMMEKQAEATTRSIDKLMDSIKETVNALSTRQTERPKSFIEQLKEFQEVKPMLLELTGAAPAEAEKPVWLQAIETIGDRIAPIIDSFQKGGVQGKMAEAKMRLAMQTHLGQRVAADNEQRRLFVSELFKKGNPETVSAMLTKLGIPHEKPLA